MMPIVLVDAERCTGCGACVEVCPGDCISLREGVAQGDEGERCIECGHCVAVCPTEALTHRCLPAEGFAPADPDAIPTPQTLRQFLRQRRSVRQYEDTPLPREMVEDLLEAARFIPTANNAQDVGFVALDDRAAIEHLSTLTVDCFHRILNLLRNPVVRVLLPLVEGRETARQGVEEMPSFQRLVEERQADGDPIFHRAPVVLIAHAQKGNGFGRDHCALAVYNVMLEALSRGLGTCLIGYFVVAWERDRRVREALDLPADRQVHVACTLGRPATTFHQVVPREPARLVWHP